MRDDQPVRGFDLDTEALADDLRALADAIDEENAYITETETAERVIHDDDVEHKLSVTVIPTGTLSERLNFDYQTEEDN